MEATSYNSQDTPTTDIVESITTNEEKHGRTWKIRAVERSQSWRLDLEQEGINNIAPLRLTLCLGTGIQLTSVLIS